MPAYEDYLPTLRFQPTLAVSPDGRRVAYVDDALGQFNAVVQELAGGEPRRVTSYADSTVVSVVWYPDGGSLLVEVDPGGTEDYQLHRVGVDGGEPVPVGSVPEVRYQLGFGCPFTPDGRQLAYAATDRSPGDQDILVRDLDTGEVRRAYTGGGHVYHGFWSPDGTWFTTTEIRSGKAEHVIRVVPADGGSVRLLTPEAALAACWLGPWLPDGTGFVVRTNAGRDFTGLAVMDAVTGELAWLDTPDGDVEHVALSDDGRMLVWAVNVDGASRLCAKDLRTGGEIAMPALPAGEISHLALTPDGRLAVLVLSTPIRPPNIATVDLDSGHLRWLAGSRPVAAEPAALVDPVLVRYPSRYGFDIPAYVYRPRSADPVGVVLAIHGGPAMQERAFYSNDGFFQYLVGNGVAVFAPNVRGSSGYGKAYQRMVYRDWGGVDLSDLADAARYLRRQDWVDPDRIGLVGRSYGGFAVLSGVSRLPELGWAAAVVWCGPSNLVTFARSQPPTWRSHVLAMFGDPDANEQFLRSRSPISYADQIKAPLFVIQGANDPRVPKHESDQIVESLRARGVDVRYDVYPDEGHRFSKRENQIKARTDAGEFLLAHLRKGAAPAVAPCRDPCRRRQGGQVEAVV
jgi:dipeptidyl aminopeptidase/acylaminoacyl peptidase